MLYTRARLRCLAALGLPVVVSPMVGCSGGGNGTSGSTPTVVVGETSSATGSESAATSETTATTAASATATDTPTKSAELVTWVPAKDGRPQPQPTTTTGPIRPMPRCPNGLVCTAASGPVKGEAAPAPYAACSAEIALPEEGPGRRQKRTYFEPRTTALERKANPNACCYEWVRPCPGGRPLRGGEGEILARAVGRRDWVAAIGDVAVVREMGSRERGIAAAHYEREAAFEHASIGAFARASMGLLGLGAPPELLSETHAAAMDEVEHARVAFALAAAFSGEARGPSRLEVGSQGALPGSLAELLAETFVDACVGETVAALALREAAAGAGDPAIAGLLSGIAEDEERHSALAWRTVAWALEAGGAEARRALEKAVEEVYREEGMASIHGGGLAASDRGGLAASVRGKLAVSEPSGLAVVERGGLAASGEGRELEGRLRACGILGEAALREVRRRAVREVVLPCAEALLSRGGQAVTRADGLARA